MTNRVSNLLKQAPDFVLDLTFEDLDFKVRTENCLRSVGITKVVDLANVSDHELLKIPNFGKTSLADLMGELEKACLRGPKHVLPKDIQPEIGKNVPQARPTSFNEYLRPWLENITDKAKNILFMRAGIGGPQLTLEAIGQELGVTRERIRQIQKKTIQKLLEKSNFEKVFVQQITELLQASNSPLYLAALPAQSTWFQIPERLLPLIPLILEAIDSKPFYLIRIENILTISRINDDEWRSTIKLAKSFMENKVHSNLKVNDLKAGIRAIAGANAEELSQALWEVSSENAIFSNDPIEDNKLLIGYGRSAETLVQAVLADSEQPLHFSEVHERALKWNPSLDIRRVHNAAASVGILLGSGTYGLRRHMPYSKSEALYFSSICEEFIQNNGADRQWYAGELLEHLLEIAPEADGLDHYMLSAILKLYSDLNDLGRQVWSHQKSVSKSGSQRVEVQPQIEEILRTEGRPIGAKALLKKVSKVRGISRFIQIHPRGEVIRVGPATWGIKDRDICVPVSEMHSYLDEIFEVLETTHQGLHISEISSNITLAQSTARDLETLNWHIFGCAQADPRFKSTSGNLLYLPSWGKPNRLIPKEALMQNQEALKKGIALEELRTLINDSLGYPISRFALHALVRDIGCIYDEKSGTWILGLDQEDP